MPILNFEKILKAFETEGVKFILVGGMAAIGHGVDYVTKDVDFCYQRKNENLTAIVKALKPSNPRLRAKDENLPFIFDERSLKNGLNFTFETDWGPVDLLGELQGVGTYETLLPRVTLFNFYGFMVDTLCLEDLIKAKQAAGRTKDKLHLLELEAIRKIQNINEGKKD